MEGFSSLNDIARDYERVLLHDEKSVSPMPEAPTINSEAQQLLETDSGRLYISDREVVTAPASSNVESVQDTLARQPDKEFIDGSHFTTGSQPCTIPPPRQRTSVLNTGTTKGSKFSIPHVKSASHDREWWSTQVFMKTWWWETICCALALGALLAIIITIHTHNFKESPRWQFGLTVNAILAVYTTILKAAAGLVVAEGISHLKWNSVARPNYLSTFVAQDQASRGPLGALRILSGSFRSRPVREGQRPNGFRVSAIISFLGALITVCILLLDPFSQQIIKTYSCEKDVLPENVTIARTNEFSLQRYDEILLSPEYRKVVWSGIFALQAQSLPFTCRTGNCSFSEPYVSLGYCSSCVNVTKQLEIKSFMFDYNTTGNTIWNTNVTLPGFIVSNSSGGESLTLTRRMSYYMQGKTRLKSHYRTEESEVALIRWNGDRATLNENQTIRGYRCQIYQCIKELKATISRNELKEETIEESGNVFDKASAAESFWQWKDSPVIADLKCVSEGDILALKALGHRINQTTRWMPYDVSPHFVGNTPEEGMLSTPRYAVKLDNYTCPSQEAAAFRHFKLCENGLRTEESLRIVPERCIYRMFMKNDVELRAKLLSPFFNGAIYDPIDSQQDYFAPSTEVLYALNGTGSGLGTMEDVERFLRGLTDALTIGIRRNGEEMRSEPAAGLMTEYTICMEVKWAWLSLAVTVVGLLLIFFVWMVVHSRATQCYLRTRRVDQGFDLPIHDFKSSALAMLFHGLDGESLQKLERESIEASNSEAKLQRETKDVVVKLVATERGWKLSAVD